MITDLHEDFFPLKRHVTSMSTHSGYFLRWPPWLKAHPDYPVQYPEHVRIVDPGTDVSLQTTGQNNS